MQTFSDTTLEELCEQGIGFPEGFGVPGVVKNHIDGPMLIMADGQLHWLSLSERFQLWMGWTDARKLQSKLRPRFEASLKAARAALMGMRK